MTDNDDMDAKLGEAVENAMSAVQPEDISPEAVAALVGAITPVADLAGLEFEELNAIKHAVYCRIFAELRPVHTAITEQLGTSSADHIVMDIFMNTLAIQMARLGDEF